MQPRTFESQTARYETFYSSTRELERWFRYDIRYRCERLKEVLRELRLSTEDKRVLDVGFGWGDLLATFPSSCEITGVDISKSAVETARKSPQFRRFRRAHFETISEANPHALPQGPFDVILCSHVLEHVPSDDRVIAAMRDRLAPGGVLIVFVPIEPPDYSPIHLRVYSAQSITERIVRHELELLHSEPSMFVEGHVFRFLTIPTRRRWPVLRYVMAGFKHTTLSAIPMRVLRLIDQTLYRAGGQACQALVIGRRP